jgi:hypothetical protein
LKSSRSCGTLSGSGRKKAVSKKGPEFKDASVGDDAAFGLAYDITGSAAAVSGVHT